MSTHVFIDLVIYLTAPSTNCKKALTVATPSLSLRYGSQPGLPTGPHLSPAAVSQPREEEGEADASNLCSGLKEIPLHIPTSSCAY